ncbi:MAG: hypothetical protein M1821_002191, partial [Bathelium mastoideum]
MASTISKRDAEKLVREIRASRHVDEPPDENFEDLSRALKLISDELYSTPTHFVLELIQNADDNQYNPDVTPTLVFLYLDSGYLWVGCNERGFTPEYVRAICRFHRSTKATAEGEKGSIGEKGIGFKSVFKIANTVWISSGPFKFRFDRDAPLGMIAPKWDEIPPVNPLVNATTVICMKIPNQDGRMLVRRHLEQLEPELPLFLRNIRKIRVIFQKGKNVEESYSLTPVAARDVPWDVELVKENDVQGSKETLLRLVHVEHHANSMPYEKRREGIKRSKLQIEFPVTEDGEPDLQIRPLYNYLPVRTYGLPFIPNADFLLSANREDVEHGKTWNEALLSETVELFVTSVHRFNQEAILKYTWPQYTKGLASTHGTVFEPLLPKIIHRLKAERILESQTGSFIFPTSLVHVPLHFTDGKSPPTPLLEHNKHCYLATSYDYGDVVHLGVNNLEISSFIGGDTRFGVDGLRAYARHHKIEFRNRPNMWHSHVANALMRTKQPGKFRNIKLIPLRDDTWIAVKDVKTFYFPQLEQGLEIPPGINMSVIDPLPARDTNRKVLFQRLGAETLDANSVCGTLLNEHAKRIGQPLTDWDRRTVISHAWYLFHARNMHSRRSLDDLGLIAEGSSLLLKSSSVYVDDGGEFSISKLVPQRANIVRYIDPGYFTTETPDVTIKFTAWLTNNSRVQTIPKLPNDNMRELSGEFKYILASMSNQRLLTLLMSFWNSYSSYRSVPEIWEKLTAVLVTCSKGSRVPLNKTFAPLPALKDEAFARGVLPFLDIGKTISEWRHLSELGVRTTLDLQFYVALLLGLSQHRSLQPSEAEVTRIYEKIEQNWDNEFAQP